MKNIAIVILVIFAISCEKKTENATESDSHENHQPEASAAEEAPKPKSPRTSSMAMVGGNHIHIDYSSPSMRGRQVFGGLVAYGEVWVTGAHKATNIKFDNDVTIGGVSIPEGKYGLFTIPGESEWTIIINKTWDMHLADDYKAEDDIVRVTSNVEVLETPSEALAFEVSSAVDGMGKVSIKWADVSVSFDVSNNK